MRSMQLVALPFAVLGLAGLARGDASQGVPFLVLAVGLLLAFRGADAEQDAR